MPYNVHILNIELVTIIKLIKILVSKLVLVYYIFRMKIVDEKHCNVLKYLAHVECGARVECGDHLNQLNCERQFETKVNVIQNFSSYGLTKINIRILL